jgi:hypothetical protein
MKAAIALLIGLTAGVMISLAIAAVMHSPSATELQLRADLEAQTESANQLRAKLANAAIQREHVKAEEPRKSSTGLGISYNEFFQRFNDDRRPPFDMKQETDQDGSELWSGTCRGWPLSLTIRGPAHDLRGAVLTITDLPAAEEQKMLSISVCQDFCRAFDPSWPNPKALEWLSECFKLRAPNVTLERSRLTAAGPIRFRCGYIGSNGKDSYLLGVSRLENN